MYCLQGLNSRGTFYFQLSLDSNSSRLLILTFLLSVPPFQCCAIATLATLRHIRCSTIEVWANQNWLPYSVKLRAPPLLLNSFLSYCRLLVSICPPRGWVLWVSATESLTAAEEDTSPKNIIFGLVARPKTETCLDLLGCNYWDTPSIWTPKQCQPQLWGQTIHTFSISNEIFNMKSLRAGSW